MRTCILLVLLLFSSGVWCLQAQPTAIPLSQAAVKGTPVYGKPVDNQTRCVHWHSPLDIIAIKFKCCNRYYPCHACHEETAGHAATVWPKNEFDTNAILCGACGHELTITAYMQCNNTCPKCHSAFNPGCKNHYHLYFEIE